MNQRHRLHVYTWAPGQDPDEDPADRISTYPADKYDNAYLDFLFEMAEPPPKKTRLVLVDLDNPADSVVIYDNEKGEWT